MKKNNLLTFCIRLLHNFTYNMCICMFLCETYISFGFGFGNIFKNMLKMLVCTYEFMHGDFSIVFKRIQPNYNATRSYQHKKVYIMKITKQTTASFATSLANYFINILYVAINSCLKLFW